MTPPLLHVNLQAGYGRTPVLHKIAFDLEIGDALGLVGTSGAGKSTLVLALLGLLPWRGGRVTGEVIFAGENLLELRERDARRIRGRHIGLIPQSPMTALNAAVSLRAHFEEAWRAHESSGPEALQARLNELISEVHLPSNRTFLNSRPGEISVGQAQRVLIALALLHRPALLIADEPTSALDPVTQAEILKLLQHLNQQSQTTLLYISHDLVSVLQICDRMAVLDCGTLVECLPVPEIEQAQHPATLALLRALPVPPRVLLQYRESSVSHNQRACSSLGLRDTTSVRTG